MPRDIGEEAVISLVLADTKESSCPQPRPSTSDQLFHALNNVDYLLLFDDGTNSDQPKKGCYLFGTTDSN